MPVSSNSAKDELITDIKEKIRYVSGDYDGIPVTLDNVFFQKPGRSENAERMNIACVFISEDGILRGDIYRSGSAGCVDFICGLDLGTLDSNFLLKIITAFDQKKWFVCDTEIPGKEKKRTIVQGLRFPFLQKGA